MPRNTKDTLENGFLPGFIRLREVSVRHQLGILYSPARFFRTFFESRWSSARGKPYRVFTRAQGIISFRLYTRGNWHNFNFYDVPPILPSRTTSPSLYSAYNVRNERYLSGMFFPRKIALGATRCTCFIDFSGTRRASPACRSRYERRFCQPINHTDDTHESRPLAAESMCRV